MRPDYPLLGLLARRPATGYDLGKWLRVDGRFLGRKPTMSPIYRALADLEDRGWVTTSTEMRGTGPEAKVHRLTAAGRAALLEWARTPFIPHERPMAPDFIVRMNFAGQLGPEYALQIVRTELAYRREQREQEHQALLAAPSPEVDPIEEIDPAWLAHVDALTHDRGWQSTSLYIGWLETTERQLAAEVARAETERASESSGPAAPVREVS